MPNLFGVRNVRVSVTLLDPKSGQRRDVEYRADRMDMRHGYQGGWLGEGSVEIILRDAEELPPPATLEHALALAVLDDEPASVQALIDDWLERHARPEGFVPREELVALLRQVEWVQQSGSYGDYRSLCPVCLHRNTNGHKPGCRLAAVLGVARDVP